MHVCIMIYLVSFSLLSHFVFPLEQGLCISNDLFSVTEFQSFSNGVKVTCFQTQRHNIPAVIKKSNVL